MADKIPRRWTNHVFVCQGCHELCKASEEAIAGAKEFSGDQSTPDADVAASFDFCLDCGHGIVAPGEKVVCQGAENEKGEPICTGAEVRRVTATRNGQTITVDWCEDCRAIAAIDDGWTITYDGKVLVVDGDSWDWQPIPAEASAQ